MGKIQNLESQQGDSNSQVVGTDPVTGKTVNFQFDFGGQNGKSAYEIALDNGFVGTEQEWLDSLQGEQGIAGEGGGDSAYQIALNNGFVGTEQEWLDSLQGEQGEQGLQGSQGIQGIQGIQGVQGDSAYQVALDNGFTGTEQEWLDSLNGEDASGIITLSSTIIVDTTLQVGQLGGLNEVAGASGDVTITFDAVSEVDFPIGSVVQYKRTSPDYDVIIAQGTGATVTETRTYADNQVINMWHKSLNVWEVLDPATPIVVLTQAEYDAITPVAGVFYYITA